MGGWMGASSSWLSLSSAIFLLDPTRTLNPLHQRNLRSSLFSTKPPSSRNLFLQERFKLHSENFENMGVKMFMNLLAKAIQLYIKVSDSKTFIVWQSVAYSTNAAHATSTLLKNEY